jgi:hypothetical protein
MAKIPVFKTLQVTLENNIQLLEQQLEEMRATYQLNTEKLEYAICLHLPISTFEAKASLQSLQPHLVRLLPVSNFAKANLRRIQYTHREFLSYVSYINDSFFKKLVQTKEGCKL